jgi:hypothetical protein
LVLLTNDNVLQLKVSAAVAAAALQQECFRELMA